MKRIASILSAAAVLAGFALTGCNNAAAPAASAAQSDTVAVAGSIVFFNIDKVLENYDMANDLMSAFETKANNINQEVQRRVNKFQKDANDFQNKINKGLMTQSTAQVQSQKLAEQQASVENYANQKQQEIAEEQQVIMNQIMDAISEYVKEYNKEKQYALILNTSGSVISSPVVAGSDVLDITDDILVGLNAAYVKTKEAETK